MFAAETLILGLISSSRFASATYPPDAPNASNVTIVALGKSRNATGGEGHVAAAGVMNPFGSIGVGCGVNWDSETPGYGGGLNAGSKDFGLGGGYRITPDTMEIGAGIGINPRNATAHVAFKGSVNGSFHLHFASSSPFTCLPSTDGAEHTLVCTTTTTTTTTN